MNITFIAKGTESLGLEYLSSVLKQRGHNVALVFDRTLFNDDTYINIPALKGFSKSFSSIATETVQTKPNLVGFSVLTNAYRWSLSVAREMKRIKDIPVIFGGVHPTLVPEEVISREEVDMVCRGEGEYPLLELIECMEKGSMDFSIKNLWFKRNGAIIRNDVRPPISNVDSLPMLDKSLFENELPMHYCYMGIAMRGCAYSCSYCSETCMRRLYRNKGDYCRQRSVNNVINELSYMKQRYHFKAVDIKSSVLSYSKDWIYDFLEEYKHKIKLPLRVMLYPKIINKDMAAKLKKAGCWQVQVGVQTFNSLVRNKILQRPETELDITHALDALRSSNMRFSVDLMTGLPGENGGDLLLSAENLLGQRGLYKIALFYLQYLPQAPITKYAQDNGILTEITVNNINKGLITNFFSTDKKEEIKRLRNFQLLFRLLPILPKGMTRFILRTKLYRTFYIMPQAPLIILIDILGALFTRDYFTLSTIKGYLWEIRRKILQSIK